jgi:predicted enzyme related to lactoylglutathione lyase
MGSVGQVHGAIATMLDEPTTEPSAGGVIDHFGFAVADVPAMIAKARFMGARILSEPRPGVTARMIAMIEDPWGTRIELLESSEFRGIQHVHMLTEGAESLRDWFLQVFGGAYDPESGGEDLHAIRYDGVWVYVSEAPDPTPPPILPDGPVRWDPRDRTDRQTVLDQIASIELYEAPVRGTLPSRGRSLDHIGFSVTDMDEIVARVRASGYEPYVTRPNRPGGTTLLMFFEGANGVHFEIAQPDGVE